MVERIDINLERVTHYWQLQSIQITKMIPLLMAPIESGLQWLECANYFIGNKHVCNNQWQHLHQLVDHQFIL